MPAADEGVPAEPQPRGERGERRPAVGGVAPYGPGGVAACGRSRPRRRWRRRVPPRRGARSLDALPLRLPALSGPPTAVKSIIGHDELGVPEAHGESTPEKRAPSGPGLSVAQVCGALWGLQVFGALGVAAGPGGPHGHEDSAGLVPSLDGRGQGLLAGRADELPLGAGLMPDFAHSLTIGSVVGKRGSCRSRR